MLLLTSLALLLFADEAPRLPTWTDQGTMAVPVHQVVPIYPDSAWLAGLEGMVVVRSLVGANGRVERTLLLKSDPTFDRAALDAAMRWTYEPARDNSGKAIPLWVAQQFRFRMNDPAYRSRTRADTTAWFGGKPGILTKSVADSLMKRMRRADEVWVYRLGRSGEKPRPPFDWIFGIVSRQRLEPGSARDRLIHLLGDPTVRRRPQMRQCEYNPDLYVRFLAEDGQVDVQVALCSHQLGFNDGVEVWGGSVDGRFHDWASWAHSVFPSDEDLKRYLHYIE